MTELIIPLRDNPLGWALFQGLQGLALPLIFVIPLLRKEWGKKWLRALLLLVGVSLSVWWAYHATDIQTAVVIQPETVLIKYARSPDEVIPASGVIEVLETRLRSDRVILVNTVRGSSFQINAPGDRRLKIAQALAEHYGLADVSAGDNRRWIRTAN